MGLKVVNAALALPEIAPKTAQAMQTATPMPPFTFLPTSRSAAERSLSPIPLSCINAPAMINSGTTKMVRELILLYPYGITKLGSTPDEMTIKIVDARKTSGRGSPNRSRTNRRTIDIKIFPMFCYTSSSIPVKSGLSGRRPAAARHKLAAV